MKRIFYISGPMKNHFNLNCDSFNATEEAIKIEFPNSKIFNPATFEHFPDWQRCLKRDVKLMIDQGVNTFALLPGWQLSKGAEIEIFLAKRLFFATIYNVTFNYFDKDNPVTFTDITDNFDINVLLK
jgi:hypothetical protein